MKKYTFSIKQIFCLIWALLLCAEGFAQQTDYFKTEINQANSFPNFARKRAAKASQNINQFIQLDVLQNMQENIVDSNALENWQVNILANNKRYLSLSIKPKNELGAVNVRHYLFNSATGSALFVSDIIVASGMALIKRNINKSLQQKIVQDQLPFDGKEIEKCLKNDINNVSINADSLVVYTRKCFETDSLGNPSDFVGISTFHAEHLSRYLSNYGQAMFGLNRKLKMKKMQSNAVIGLYRGKWNQEDIILQLDAPFEKTLKGVLYIVSKKQAIAINGTFKSNRLEVDTELGKINLSISAGRAQGNIRGLDKKMSYMQVIKQ